jgi:hypothetical protein
MTTARGGFVRRCCRKDSLGEFTSRNCSLPLAQVSLVSQPLVEKKKKKKKKKNERPLSHEFRWIWHFSRSLRYGASTARAGS